MKVMKILVLVAIIVMLASMAAFAGGDPSLNGIINPYSAISMPPLQETPSWVYNPAEIVPMTTGVNYTIGRHEKTGSAINMNMFGRSAVINTKFGTLKASQMEYWGNKRGSEINMSISTYSTEFALARQWGRSAFGVARVIDGYRSAFAYNSGAPILNTAAGPKYEYRVGATYQPKTDYGQLELGLTYAEERGRAQFLYPTSIESVAEAQNASYFAHGTTVSAQYKMAATTVKIGYQDITTAISEEPNAKIHRSFFTLNQGIGHNLTAKVGASGDSTLVGASYAKGPVNVGSSNLRFGGTLQSGWVRYNLTF